MSTLPEAYLGVIMPLIDKARGFLERGDPLYPIAFVGNFTTQSTYPVLMNTEDQATKDATSRAIHGLAELCEADFVLVISESWALRKDKMPHMERIMAQYGSIGASPYRVDSVSITLETPHGLWVTCLPIKPKGVSKKKRTFGVPDFQLFTEVEGRACSSSALPFTHPNIDDENLTMQQDLDLDDVLTLEGNIETDEVNYFVTLQRAINSGLWQLQGSTGRAMMAAIKGGSCMLGQTKQKDAWGNTVPARTDVKAGTPGSFEFVVQTRGIEWAERMAAAGETPH